MVRTLSMDDEVNYLFHVHRHVPRWRLVIRSDLGFPEETTADEWRFTRARLADDTNVEVRDMIEADGYSLFKVGGAFEDVEADRADRHWKRARWPPRRNNAWAQTDARCGLFMGRVISRDVPFSHGSQWRWPLNWSTKS